MADLSGCNVGRYRIIEPLGRGGMAVVYRAYDKSLERDVAIKFIRTEAIPPERLAMLLKRFEREAKRMAHFTHPNIVPIIDYGEYEGTPFLVMPFLSGGTLKEHLQTRGGEPLEIREALRLSIPVARALEYAHARDTIHRDVKPSNILLTDEGQPMLSDFGVAKILDLDEEETITEAGVGVGTVKYMAPEQWKNKVTVQTDVYALGVVLYEMLTGIIPPESKTPGGVHGKQSSEMQPRPRMLNPHLSEELERVILRALASEPGERFLEMSHFAEALERIARSEHIDSDKSLSPQVLEDDKSTLILQSEPQEPEMEQRTMRVSLTKLVMSAVLILAGLGLLGWVLVEILSGGKNPLKPLAFLTTKELTLSNVSPLTPTPQLISTPRPGTQRISEKDGMDLVYIPAGEFTMGKEDWPDERPAHSVFLDGYWIDRTEVTNSMYTLCVEENACTPPRKKDSHTRSSYYGDPNYAAHPIIDVDWYQASAYCEWAGGRLPSEAEWEKAARGTEQNVYPWGIGIDCEVANFKGKEFGTAVCVGDTKSVGSYTRGASPYGVLDMAGNVAEWVQDWYDGQYYARSPQANPLGPSGGDQHVIRGGGWNNSAREVRVTHRMHREPGVLSDTTGFRCVRP